MTSTAPVIRHEAVSETSTACRPPRSESSQNRASALFTSEPPYIHPAGRASMQGMRVALGTDCAISTKSSPSSIGQLASVASPARALHDARVGRTIAIAATLPIRRRHFMRTRSSC